MQLQYSSTFHTNSTSTSINMLLLNSTINNNDPTRMPRQVVPMVLRIRTPLHSTREVVPTRLLSCPLQRELPLPLRPLRQRLPNNRQTLSFRCLPLVRVATPSSRP